MKRKEALMNAQDTLEALVMQYLFMTEKLELCTTHVYAKAVADEIELVYGELFLLGYLVDICIPDGSHRPVVQLERI